MPSPELAEARRVDGAELAQGLAIHAQAEARLVDHAPVGCSYERAQAHLVAGFGLGRFGLDREQARRAHRGQVVVELRHAGERGEDGE